MINVYTDGSWDVKGKFAKWAFIAVQDDKVIHQEKGEIHNAEVNEGQQIGGELKAVIQAVVWAKKNNHKIVVYHDYIGIRSWIADIYNEKPWNTNKSYTKKYREFMLKNKSYIENMIWIKGHSDNKYNNLVDELAGS
jgi:ribonuclease HI